MKLANQLNGLQTMRQCLVSRLRFLRRALSYYRAGTKWIVAWIVLAAVGIGLGMLAAWPAAILVDSVLNPGLGHAERDLIHRLFLALVPSGRIGQIIGLAAIGLLLKVIADGLATGVTVLSNHVNYSALVRVRCDLYRKLQAMNLGYHRSRPLGDAIYRLTADAYGCQNILNVVVSAILAAVTLGVMAAVLCTRSLSLTVLAFSIAPPLAVANLVFARRLQRRTLECKASETKFTSVIQQSLACIGLIQAFGREDEEFGVFHGTLRESVRAWWRLNHEQIAYNLIVGFLFAAGGAAILGYGGYLVHQGKLSVGDLMVFTAYLGLVWGPLCQMTGFSANLQNGVAGAQRVFEVLDREQVIVDAPDAVPLPRRPRRLELDRVWFAYGPNPSTERQTEELEGLDDMVLRDLSVTIEPGQIVAFVGSSGAGKSTLLNLLPRFYDPSKGVIRLSGIDVRSVRVKDLRKHVALVLQDSVILPTTIAENIAYGRPGATRHQIMEAARLAGAAGFIEQQPQGYATPIAEGGANLSGGQRQRIAIARALLTEAPVLVLDEPTSALDGHHEQLIAETLTSLKGQRTVIVVTHRLSTIVSCDQIFVMDGGRIVEQGTHGDLIAQSGLYRQMARDQLGAAPAVIPALIQAA